jgi:hypothetical protein
MQGAAATEANPPAGLVLQRIVSVRADGATHAVYLEFADGFTGSVDLGPIIRPTAVTAPLANPDFFAQAVIGARGRSLEWPGEIELCADALRQRAAGR